MIHFNDDTAELCPASNSIDPASKPKTILLVDDDPKQLRSLERALSGQSFQLLTAICPAEARIVLSRHEIDLVVSDNLMTGEFGTEFLAGVSRAYPQVKLIMFSGYLPLSAAKRMEREFGVFRILHKPCEASVVAAAIREALADD